VKLGWLALACVVVECHMPAAIAGAQNVARGPLDVEAPTANDSGHVPAVPTATVFRAGVDLVALNVVVTDASQKPVAGLSASDFTVLEDGVRQEVSFFAATAVPLDLAILLDTSGSMGASMGLVQEAAMNFVATLRAGDRAMVVDIKNATKILYPLGPDVAMARRAIQSTTAAGGTGLYNGLYLTIKELGKVRRSGVDEIRRQAIVVLSDGLDTASLITFDDVMDVAKQSGVAIYTITVRSRPKVASRYAAIEPPSEYSMKTLAAETGARAYFPQTLGELDTVYGAIAKELAHQYAMAYIPKNAAQDGAFRRIAVQVADYPGARTRTRSGYTSSRPARGVE
jgi:Ca-activated chloride channel family protein